MKPRSFHGLCAALAFVVGSSALAQDKPVTVNLAGQNASGESGTATLTPQGDKGLRSSSSWRVLRTGLRNPPISTMAVARNSIRSPVFRFRT